MMLKSKPTSPQELYRQRKFKEEQERSAHLPPGLINHGNTCFMNSVLQGLIATNLLHDLVNFTSPLASSRSPQLTNGHGFAGNHEQPWTDSMPIGDQFHIVMSRAWKAQSEKKREAQSPKPLLAALGKKYIQYCDFAQQDAHEFLRILFDAIRMEEVDVIKKRQPPPAPKKSPFKRKRASQHLPAPNDTHDTLLPFPDMLFGGQLASILVCQKCKRISQTYEDFYDISLSINPEDYALSSPSLSPPPLGGAANFFANSFKNVGKGKGKEIKDRETREEKNSEPEPADRHHHHGRERRRDKFKKLARRIAVFNTHGSPRASSVPPDERSINGKDKDIVVAKAAGGRDPLRRTRSRSLDHFHQVSTLKVDDVTPEVVIVRESSDAGETGEDERETSNSGCGESTTMSATAESDWSVVKHVVIGEEKVDEAPQNEEKKVKEKRVKDKEADGWTKLGKRISMSVGLTRQPRDKGEKERKDQDKDRKHVMNPLFDDIRARRKSRESSPDSSGFRAGATTHSERSPVPPVPPIPRPASTPPSSSLPPVPYASHVQHHSSHTPSSRPPRSSKDKELPEPPSLIDIVSIAKSSLSRSKSRSQPSSPKHTNYKSHSPRSPTSAQSEYLRRILADTDVSASKSSPTPSGGWTAPAAPSPSLVNPFALLIKSGGAKHKANGVNGNESVTKPDGTATAGESDALKRSLTTAGSTSNSHSGKWSSWLGMNRLSGIEECLRLFTSVEVLDSENMVGCRRCWKIANEEKGRNEGEHGDDEDDGEDEDEDEDSEDQDEDSNSKEERLLPPGLSPHPDTPGGMPIPTISTTGPEIESPFEPFSPRVSTAPRSSRILHPVRSNSADFISLSTLSLREVSRLETDNIPNASVSFIRNASSPTLASPVSQFPDTSFLPPLPPYPLSNGVEDGRDSLVIPSVPITQRMRLKSSTDGESDEYESASAVESSRSGDVTDFLDVDDGLSIGSTPTEPPTLEDSIGSEAVDPNSTESPIVTGEPEEAPPVAADAAEPVDPTSQKVSSTQPPPEATNKTTKPPKKPKPVIMRPAYKRYLISTAPPVLVIHLKRFQQTNKTPFISFTPTYGFRKLEDYVTFPEYLDLAPFLAPKKEDYGLEKHDNGNPNRVNGVNEVVGKNGTCMYRLYAVVVHIGNMLGGHYVAYTAIPERPSTRPGSSSSQADAQNDSRTSVSESTSAGSTLVADAPPPLQASKSKSGRQERLWAYISDTTVRLATLEEVLKAKAYICMYERIC